MKHYAGFLCALITLILFACTAQRSGQTAIKEGISGQVKLAEGNMMPGPGKKTEPKAVEREIRVYKVLKAEQAEGEAPLYSAIKGDLVAKIKSDSNGRYSCKLAPGSYSVFTIEADGKLFSSLSNSEGELSPVTVLPNEITVYDILVNHSAVY